MSVTSFLKKRKVVVGEYKQNESLCRCSSKYFKKSCDWIGDRYEDNEITSLTRELYVKIYAFLEVLNI